MTSTALANLAVSLLESRRDHLIAARGHSPDAFHTVELTNRSPSRVKVLESQYAAELWAEDYGETRGYLGDEPGVVEEVVFEGERIGVIRLATADEVASFDGGDYFAMGAW